MSADNFLAIIKGDDGKWRGYEGFAEDDARKVTMSKAVLEADTMEEAARKANEYCRENIVEYGYYFDNP